ncbi:helix-turn-helix transcriptional regulator [Methylobacter sp. G7]|uniref:helix-turn-helix domain-containing protein n=1 Tax=Methylobacter sp. G7 TaxID=3230117 RepID=UPI003D80596B
MKSFSERLKEERLRMKLTQVDFGGIGGVKKGAQLKYESGERSPDALYLSSIAAAGADVNYIITGQRIQKVSEESPGYTLRPDQKALLDNVEHCSKEDQDCIKRMALLAARAIDQDETQQQELKKQANGD